MITCTTKKSCDVRLTDTSFGLSCPFTPDTGFAQGTGSIKRNVLTVMLTLRCLGATEPVKQLNFFDWDRRNGALTNRNDDFDEAPPSDNPPVPSPNVFHKISR